MVVPQIPYLKGACRGIFDEAMLPNNWTGYKLKLREFKNVTRKVKRTLCKPFCEMMEWINAACRACKLVARTQSDIESIKSGDDKTKFFALGN